MATTSPRELRSAAIHPWESIFQYVNKAVVFLDGPAAECLHWVGGMQMLLKAGATNVKEFSSFENGSAEDKKAVFVVSDMLANTSEEVLQDIVTGSHFRHCIAMTTLPHSLHLHLLEHGGVEGANTGGEKIFRQLEGRMKRWMKVRQIQNPEAQVVHIPMFAATISNNLFLSPQHSTLFPLLDIELSQLKEQSAVQGPRKRALVFSTETEKENRQVHAGLQRSSSVGLPFGPRTHEENNTRRQQVPRDANLASALDDDVHTEEEESPLSNEIKVEVVVHSPSKVRHHTLKGPWAKVGKALAYGDKTTALQQILRIPGVQREASLMVAKVVEREAIEICKKPAPGAPVSAFRDNSPAALQRWNYDEQKSELEMKCPTLLTLLEAAAVNKQQTGGNKIKTEESLVPAIVTTASIIFNCRSQNMSAHQTLTGLQLKRAGADKKCFARLNTKKLSVVHDVVKKVQWEFGKNHDEKVHEWLEEMRKDKDNETCTVSCLQDLQQQVEVATGYFQMQVASAALRKRKPRLEAMLEDLNKHRNPGFRLVGDNVDLKIKPRYMSSTHQTTDHHHFQYIAVKNRVPCMHLPDDTAVNTPETIPLTELQPNANDNKALHYEWSVLAGRMISSHLPALSWMNTCLPMMSHQYTDVMKKKSEIVNLGVMMHNENTKAGIAVIIQELHKYTPRSSDGKPITVVSGGDLLTCEREIHAIEDQRDAFTPTERLEGLQPVIEDFHTLGNFYQAIWKELHHNLSSGDIGTLMSARNLLQAKNVTSDPMKNLNAAKTFLDKYTEALVIAAAMQFFGMDSPTAEPTNNIVYPLEQCQDRAMEVLGMLVDTYAIPSTEEFEVSQTTDLKCPHCGRDFQQLTGLRTHVKSNHSRLRVKDVGNVAHADESNNGDSVYNYSCNALSMCLLAYDFDDARKHGDGERVMRILKFFMLHFKIAGKFKYANHVFRHIAQVKCFLSPRLSHEVMWNRSVNTRGKKDTNVEHDRKVEHDNRTYKENVRGFRGKVTEKSVERVSRSAQKIEAVLLDIDKSTGIKTQSGAHDAPDQSSDILTLVGRFHGEEIFTCKPGRHHHFFPDFPRSVLNRLNIDEFHDWMKSHLDSLSEQNMFQCINK